MCGPGLEVPFDVVHRILLSSVHVRVCVHLCEYVVTSVVVTSRRDFSNPYVTLLKGLMAALDH